MDSIELTINGKKFSEFLKFKMEKNMENIAHTFNFSMPFSAGSSITRGSAVSIKINNSLELTGYVNAVSKKLEANTPIIEVAGRSKTGDLVDCSITSEQTINQTLLDICKKICADFNITVSSDFETGVIPVFQLKNQQIYEGIAKQAALQGFTLLTDENGNLKITKPQPVKLPNVINTDNIIKAEYTETEEEYKVYKAIKAATMSDAGYFQSFLNPNFDNPKYKIRYRIKTFDVDSSSVIASVENMAKFEYARTRPFALKIEVAGFTNNAGKVWNYNTMNKIEIPILEVSDSYLLQSVEFNYDDGATTNLMFCNIEKFRS